jgi:hypothetical protein
MKYLLLRQARLVGAHFDEGIHKLDEPVSKMTVKFCAGVPKEMGPKY